MGEHNVKCSACGLTLTADSKEELGKKLQEHAKHAHDMDMPDEKVKEAVDRGHT